MRQHKGTSGRVKSLSGKWIPDFADEMSRFKLSTSEGNSPESYRFSPRPTPKLIATRHTSGPALAVSRGIDRDRAVDESGNQLAVFGRRGARPFNRAEAERLYLRDCKLYTVTDAPPQPPQPVNSALLK